MNLYFQKAYFLMNLKESEYFLAVKENYPVLKNAILPPYPLDHEIRGAVMMFFGLDLMNKGVPEGYAFLGLGLTDSLVGIYRHVDSPVYDILRQKIEGFRENHPSLFETIELYL